MSDGVAPNPFLIALATLELLGEGVAFAAARCRRGRPRRATSSPPQELQIAQIAAQGLTNREIGQQL